MREKAVQHLVSSGAALIQINRPNEKAETKAKMIHGEESALRSPSPHLEECPILPEATMTMTARRREA